MLCAFLTPMQCSGCVCACALQNGTICISFLVFFFTAMYIWLPWCVEHTHTLRVRLQDGDRPLDIARTNGHSAIVVLLTPYSVCPLTSTIDMFCFDNFCLSPPFVSLSCFSFALHSSLPSPCPCSCPHRSSVCCSFTALLSRRSRRSGRTSPPPPPTPPPLLGHRCLLPGQGRGNMSPRQAPHTHRR